MSNILRAIKRNKARAMGLDPRFFLDSYQERLQRRRTKELKKLEKLVAQMDVVEEFITEAELESGTEV